MSVDDGKEVKKGSRVKLSLGIHDANYFTKGSEKSCSKNLVEWCLLNLLFKYPLF